MLAEDFEDVNGMARQVGLAADLVDASFLAITGDLTFAGLAVETYIIDTIDYYSEETARLLHSWAARHPGGPRRSRGTWLARRRRRAPTTRRADAPAAGRPTHLHRRQLRRRNVLRDPEVDIDRLVDDALDEACAEQPDLVLLHDHLLGRRIAEAGCQEVAVLDGRSFQFVGPQEVHDVRRHRRHPSSPEAAAEGHTDTRPDPGRIRNPARFAVLTVRPDTGEATYALVTVSPDASVTVTPEIDLGTSYERFAATGDTGLARTPSEPRPGQP